MKKFNQAKFESEAKEMAASYLGIDEKDLSMAWFRKVGSNEAVLCINVDPGPYYYYFDVLYLNKRGRYIMTVYTYEDCTFYDDELLLNEKQKNCPYCHPPYKPFISSGKGTFIDLEHNSSPICVGISNVLGEGPITETLGEVVNVLKLPSCPFCGRKLSSID